MRHDSSPPDPKEPQAPSAPNHLELGFAELKAEARAELGRLRALGREVALAAAGRIEAVATEAETCLGDFELAKHKKRVRQRQVGALARLVKRLGAIAIEPERGRRRDLKRVSRSVQSTLDALTRKTK